jgi:hypothetical protein
MMTDQSQTSTKFRAPLRSQDLSPGQRSLVDLMHMHQFGRLEDMPVRAGRPILNSEVKVVRVARFGSAGDAAKVTRTDEFELKRQVRDLFEELKSLQDGTVIRLEFRHGMPLLLETTPTVVMEPEPPPVGFVWQNPNVSSSKQPDHFCVKGNRRAVPFLMARQNQASRSRGVTAEGYVRCEFVQFATNRQRSSSIRYEREAVGGPVSGPTNQPGDKTG